MYYMYVEANVIHTYALQCMQAGSAKAVQYPQTSHINMQSGEKAYFAILAKFANQFTFP